MGREVAWLFTSRAQLKDSKIIIRYVCIRFLLYRLDEIVKSNISPRMKSSSPMRGILSTSGVWKVCAACSSPGGGPKPPSSCNPDVCEIFMLMVQVKHPSKSSMNLILGKRKLIATMNIIDQKWSRIKQEGRGYL
jgi:hypothetical protein